MPPRIVFVEARPVSTSVPATFADGESTSVLATFANGESTSVPATFENGISDNAPYLTSTIVIDTECTGVSRRHTYSPLASPTPANSNE